MAEQRNLDVIVVGAGMAGLTAARALGEGGLRVCVLEAREQVGGRIMTQRVGSEAIELGAEFVHGRPPELWALIDEMRETGVETFELDGSQVGLEGGALKPISKEMEEVFGTLDDLEDWTGPDCSFAEYLDRKDIEGEQRQEIVGNVEGFNAADHRVISAASLGAQQKAERSTEGDLLSRVKGGYDQLPEYLADKVVELGGSVLLGHRVQEVRWRKGRVEIVTKQGTFTAPRAVVTLPLGVLQRESVTFTPAVSRVLEAAELMRMGQVCRLTMVFRRRFWEELEPQPEMRSLSFLFAFGMVPRAWWTSHPEESNTLTGWAGGPRAGELLGMAPAELRCVATERLAEIMGLDTTVVQAEVVGCYTHDWSADEFALGAYSYVGVGGLGASATMAEPVEETLYFAGEHTDVTAHWGTVHGAMRSGLRVAEQILESE